MLLLSAFCRRLCYPRGPQSASSLRSPFYSYCFSAGDACVHDSMCTVLFVLPFVACIACVRCMYVSQVAFFLRSSFFAFRANRCRCFLFGLLLMTGMLLRCCYFRLCCLCVVQLTSSLVHFTSLMLLSRSLCLRSAFGVFAPLLPLLHFCRRLCYPRGPQSASSLRSSLFSFPTNSSGVVGCKGM